MAIAFARARYLSRASGGNAVRSAAYNAREVIQAERTGELFHFRHRDAPEHHEVLPDGAAPRFADCATLWNAAEAAERRKDAQVAREIVLALPADRELTTADRIELARSFAEQHFVSKGLAVQLDVHAPHKERGEGEGAYAEGTGGDHTNWHAHLLITTRRLEGEGFAASKARDLDPEVRRAGSRAVVADGEAWGETWRVHQDRYFQEHGIALRVDATAVHPGEHIGPVRMRKVDSPAVERAEALRQSNQAAARDPEQVLAALTRNNATFTERELDRYLQKHLGTGPDGMPDTAQVRDIADAKRAVLGHRDVLALHDRETGEVAGRYTTSTVREQERAALADGAAVADAWHHRGVSARHQEAALASRTLRDDQRVAFEHAVSAGGLKIIEGRAGTGKSYTLAAVREAHERAGHRVVGLAPTNAVAQDLKADGFTEAATVHSALFGIKNGRSPGWDSRTVLVLDEAAMLDSRVTGELLAEARVAGARVVLAGDDRQLASIERGGLFTELRKAHGAAEITEVTRQRVALASDVVVENFRPGVMERLGLSSEMLRAEKPNLVWCSISGFGQTGPYRDKPAYDMIVQAMSGGMSLTGEASRPAVRAGIPIGDLAAGLYAAIAVLAALRRRDTTGRGDTADISMLDCHAALLCYQGAYHLHSGDVPGRQGRGHDSFAAYRSFECRGGVEVVVCANTERMWAGLCAATGLDALPADPRFLTNRERHANREALWPLLEAAFAGLDVDEAVRRLEAASVPVGIVQTLDRVVKDPQLMHRQMVLPLGAPDGRAARVMSDPVRFAEAPRPAPRFPPRLGEDTAAVLAEVGLA